MNSIYHYFLFFVLYSFLGWLYESSFYTIQHHRLVNSGFLKGCICPIYGAGALLSLMLLGEIQNTFLLFVTAMLVCCTLEYFVSWLLEEMFGTRWWDYTNWPLNINGRVCIYGALAFGVLIVMLIKYIHPFVSVFVSRMDMRTVQTLCALFSVLILADMIYTVRHTEAFFAKLWFVREQPKLFEDGGPGLLGRNKTIIADKISSIRSFGLNEISVLRSISIQPQEIIRRLKDHFRR
ncbi:MAG: putative ABC transporter permease [Clostridiales bacterium]|nr:putative ABC transporter permease [Clostridiales bacterium]